MQYGPLKDLRLTFWAGASKDFWNGFVNVLEKAFFSSSFDSAQDEEGDEGA